MATSMQGPTVRSMRDQFAAAEMSVRLGANMVIMHDS